MIKEEIVYNNIETRRTVKPENYSSGKISDEKIRKVLKMANWAPTHGYTEPWRFEVFTKKGLARFALEHAEMYKANTSERSFKKTKYDKIIARGEKASHLIAIIAKRGENPKIPFVEELCSVACAVQNIMLAASSSGIASYWNTGGMTYHKEMHDYFELGSKDKLLGFIYLGVAKQPLPKGRRLSKIEAKTTWHKK